MNNQSFIEKQSSEIPVCETSDWELVSNVRKGEIKAFEKIMRRHNQRLYRIARSILKEDNEAMDVVQETYVKAYFQLQQFKGPDGFSGWLSRIASNEAMMRLRKSKRIVYSIDNPNLEHPDIESNELQPMDIIAHQQLHKILEDAIDKLSLDYRTVYVMRAVQQLNTRETAEALGVTESLIKTRYLRAKKSLHKVLEETIKSTELEVFEFAGSRCDAIVKNVMKTITLV